MSRPPIMKTALSALLLALLPFAAPGQEAKNSQPARAANPIIQADVPDIAIIRVGDSWASGIFHRRRNVGAH